MNWMTRWYRTKGRRHVCGCRASRASLPPVSSVANLARNPSLILQSTAAYPRKDASEDAGNVSSGMSLRRFTTSSPVSVSPRKKHHLGFTGMRLQILLPPHQPLRTRESFRASMTAAHDYFSTTTTGMRGGFTGQGRLDEEIQNANARYESYIVIKASPDQEDGGWGVFSAREFQAGDILIDSNALQVDSTRGSHTIQVDWEKHVYMDLPARFLNHVCEDPNAGLQPNDNGAYRFVALRDIEPNEEIVIDYETAEYQMDMICHCGTPNCRRRLRGFKHHGPIVLKQYGKEFIAPYLFSRD